MSDIKQTVTFTEDVEVTAPGGAVTFEAKAGETMDLLAPSANRWIRRKKAVAGKAALLKAEKPEPEVTTNKNAAPLTAADDATKTSTVKAINKSAKTKKAAPKKQAD